MQNLKRLTTSALLLTAAFMFGCGTDGGTTDTVTGNDVVEDAAGDIIDGTDTVADIGDDIREDTGTVPDTTNDSHPDAEPDTTDAGHPDVDPDTGSDVLPGCECFIDGTCVAEGTISPDHACAKCDSATDPNNWTPLASNTVCRPVAGLCDLAEETCDGTSLDCPADTVEPADTECRPATGACDKAEVCDGTSPLCPDDEFLEYGYPCEWNDPECVTRAVCDGQGPDGAANCKPQIFSIEMNPICRAGDIVCDCTGDMIVAAGWFTGLDEPRNIFIQGKLAYVVGGDDESGWLKILDVSDLDNIQLLTTETGLAYPTTVYVRGEIAFISEHAGVLLDTWSDTATSKYFIDMRISGDYAYISNYHDGFRIVNISDPSDLTLTESVTAMNVSMFGLDVIHDTLYICEYDDGLMIYDVSNPASPVLKDTEHLNAPGESSRCKNVVVRGNDAFVLIDGEDTALFSLDVSDPANPAIKDTANWNNANVRDLFIVDDTLYIQEYDEVVVFDVSDVDQIEALGTRQMSGINEARSLFVSGGMVYVPYQPMGGNQGVAIFNSELCTYSEELMWYDGGCMMGFKPTKPGEMVFSEIMADPGLSDGFQPEWIELTSNWAQEYDMKGCILTIDEQVYTLGTLPFKRAGTLVIGNTGNHFESMWTPVDYTIPELNLPDDGATITLTCNDVVIDSVSYDAAAVIPGQSWCLDSAYLYDADNDDPTHWCPSPGYTYGELIDGFLRGSPGKRNISCE